MLLPDNGGKALARRLLDEGFEDLRDVPAERMPPGRLALIHRVTVAGEPHLDADRAHKTLAALPYPRFFFDFETINLSVPIWAGTRP